MLLSNVCEHLLGWCWDAWGPQDKRLHTASNDMLLHWGEHCRLVVGCHTRHLLQLPGSVLCQTMPGMRLSITTLGQIATEQRQNLTKLMCAVAASVPCIGQLQQKIKRGSPCHAWLQLRYLFCAAIHNPAFTLPNNIADKGVVSGLFILLTDRPSHRTFKC